MPCDPYRDNPLDDPVNDTLDAARIASHQCSELATLLDRYDSRSHLEDLETIAGLLFDAATLLVSTQTILRWTGHLDQDLDDSTAA